MPVRQAVFDAELTGRIVRQLEPAIAPRLRVLCVLQPPPDEALLAAGLVLVRRSAVSCSWLSAFGWPLYVYRRAAVGGGQEVVVMDETFAAAAENSMWFSMV